ncbi:hypothetical protein [Gordonia shandongensis]|uniref:hypothetical protein n=1 Tax=Gordonia shandongensis TaxID=376351 RepID=UPI000422461A|nr:hypothetical protein [Gordonia shandongensis]
MIPSTHPGWRACHLAAALSAPWLTIAIFLYPAGAGRDIPVWTTISAAIAAVSCAALAVSAALLRRSGPSAAATVPFAVAWAAGAAFWAVFAAVVATADCLPDPEHPDPEYTAPDVCTAGFGLFVLFPGIPVGIVVTAWVLTSIGLHGVRRRPADG